MEFIFQGEREATNMSMMMILICARTEESSPWVLGGEKPRESPWMG